LGLGFVFYFPLAGEEDLESEDDELEEEDELDDDELCFLDAYLLLLFLFFL
jgi:hypothetical protein